LNRFQLSLSTANRTSLQPLTPPQPQDIPRVMEIAKKFGREFLPPPGA
jgi:hypothetical protein